MYADDTETANIAATLAKVLPEAKVVQEIDTQVRGLSIAEIAVPGHAELKEVKIDLEPFLPNPRRTKSTASFSDAASFLAYIERHRNDGTVTWCEFNPQTFALKFTAVIDEHVKDLAGWRAHRAVYEPAMSVEWRDWTGRSGSDKAFEQVAFAEWIQEHEEDITAANGMPSSLQMLEMATNFVMNEDRQFKSAVRLQNGGINLTYVADQDAGTTEAMKLFERFAIGIPVFRSIAAAWSITARLKYRQSNGKLKFFYELVRPDRVHEAAAKELIQQIRESLGGVPLLMGSAA